MAVGMTPTRPGRVLWLLSAATLIPVAVLAWLSVRILTQDREVEHQRQREALEVAAGLLALEADRHLQQIDERLSRGEGMEIAADGPVSSHEWPLLYREDAVPSVE